MVHLNNGIGRFLGLERRMNHVGIETEFMLLEYADKRTSLRSLEPSAPRQQIHWL